MNSRQHVVLLVDAIDTSSEVETRYPSLGPAYLASAARHALGQTTVRFRIFSGDPRFSNDPDIQKPDLVGISAVTQNYSLALNIANHYSTLNVPVIFGGIHVTALPESIPQNVFAACLGESEITFPSLLEAILSGETAPADLARIPGLAYWCDGKLAFSPPRPPIPSLDTILPPARDLLPHKSHAYMFTSRGCPFHCCFCASSHYWGKPRFFSAEYIFSEIDQLVREQNVQMISFFDDLFSLDLKRLEDLLRLLDARGLRHKIPFTCSCRANLMTEDLADLLSQLGVVSVGFGFESGSDEVLRYLKGPGITVADNARAITLLKRKGIAVNGSFVIGSPFETEEQVQMTFDFIRRSGVDLYDIYLLTPLPGTPLWNRAIERNLVSPTMANWKALSVNHAANPGKAILLAERMERQTIVAWFRKFHRYRYFHNFKHIWAHPMLRDLPRWLFQNFWEYVSRLSGR